MPNRIIKAVFAGLRSQQKSPSSTLPAPIFELIDILDSMVVLRDGRVKQANRP